MDRSTATRLRNQAAATRSGSLPRPKSLPPVDQLPPELQELAKLFNRLVEDRAATSGRKAALERETHIAPDADVAAFAEALLEGSGDPGKPQQERVAAELDEARRRLRALDLAIRQAEADFGVRLAEIRAGWTAELDQRMTAARSELGKALGRATAARQGVQDVDNLLIWLEGWPAGSYTPFAGRVPGIANEQGNVLAWPQVLNALGVAAG